MINRLVLNILTDYQNNQVIYKNITSRNNYNIKDSTYHVHT